MQGIRFASIGVLALVAWVLGAFPARAQQLDVTGNWQTFRPSGRYDMVLEQNGDKVTGTYHLGTLSGTLQGNVLTGTYSDIMTRGQVRLVFDGSASFRGSAGSGAGNGGEEWTGRRVSASVVTPATILAARAQLSRVFQPGGDYAAQAAQACENAFKATFAEMQGGAWATIAHQGGGGGGFAPALGAPANGTVWEQVVGVRVGATRSQSLSEADRLNGWEFKGTVGVSGTSLRQSFDGRWQDWRPLPPLPLVNCTFSVRGGRAAIEAYDSNLGVELDRLTRPNAP